MTVRDFHEEFESSITAPSVLYSDPEALREEKYRALVRLTEELIIVERARELEIEVSDEELAKAVEGFKQDYPDDTFEATLLENGISYLSWEKGLKRRLLMEKVIRKDISEDAFQVPLPSKPKTDTETDVATDALLSGDESEDTAPASELPENSEAEAADSSDTMDETEAAAQNLAATLPVNVGEAEYNAWIDGLRSQYTIEIDWDLWEKIEKEDTGS
jgi:hypothetical protein